jgi:hypothetical protein
VQVSVTPERTLWEPLVQVGRVLLNSEPDVLGIRRQVHVLGLGEAGKKRQRRDCQNLTNLFHDVSISHRDHQMMFRF